VWNIAMSLWVYTRVNTNIDPELTSTAESTGSGVVLYFTVPDYIDLPVA
jgi:hypothetical protein